MMYLAALEATDY